MLSDDEAKTNIESILERIYGEKEKINNSTKKVENIKDNLVEETKEIVIEDSQVGGATTQLIKEKVDLPKPITIQTKEAKLVKIEEKIIPLIEEKVELLTKKRKIKPKKGKLKVEGQTNLRDKSTEQKIIFEDEFAQTIRDHLNEKSISILDVIEIKKNRELNFIVTVPSNVGDLKYFVKARKRKRLSEGDILLAFTESQSKNLPLLFISNAELSNKAKAYIENNLPGMNYIKIEDD